MVFVRFLCETQPNRCRVFCRVSIGYYGLSLSVGLLHAVARASSYGLKSLKKLKKTGVTIISIEHNINIIMEISDNVLALDQGRIIAFGPP